ncbi:hypothetical protein QBC41DRAFT_140982 [Cercophora samala]|uniref:Uncharacterized protein n=1 Tax=Cercophora samala TaxID=330535 RepID=A0AA39ZBG6_9PEZI|nr:hypothetical protein QBC41DRAFT_140982 [Cercophora samala]
MLWTGPLASHKLPVLCVCVSTGPQRGNEMWSLVSRMAFGGRRWRGTNYWISSFPIPVPEGKDMWDSACTAWTRREGGVDGAPQRTRGFPYWDVQAAISRPRTGKKELRKTTAVNRANTNVDPGADRGELPSYERCWARVHASAYVSGRPVELFSFPGSNGRQSATATLGPMDRELAIDGQWFGALRTKQLGQECEEPILREALMHGDSELTCWRDWTDTSSVDSPEPGMAR